MTRRSGGRPSPSRTPKPSTVSTRTDHSTVGRPIPRQRQKPKAEPRALFATTPGRPPAAAARPPRRIARIVEDDEASLLDVIDNLLSRGVMLNAEVILALADVDLVYLRLSALLCAADRIVPRLRG